MVEYVQGHLDTALELSVVALCLYPFEHTPYYREVWEHVMNIYADICRQQGIRAGARLLHRAKEQSVTRQGYFTYLNVAPTIHEQQTAQVLRRVMEAGGFYKEL